MAKTTPTRHLMHLLKRRASDGQPETPQKKLNSSKVDSPKNVGGEKKSPSKGVRIPLAESSSATLNSKLPRIAKSKSPSKAPPLSLNTKSFGLNPKGTPASSAITTEPDNDGLIVELCQGGKFKDALVLLHHDASIKIKDLPGGQNLVHLCCSAEGATTSDLITLLKELVDRGLDTRAADANGNTPLHLAAASGAFNRATAGFFERHAAGDTVDAKNNDGRTPLMVLYHETTWPDKQSTQRAFLKAFQPDLEATDGQGRTLLTTALLAGDRDTARLLLQHGASAAAVYQGERLLSYFVRLGDPYAHSDGNVDAPWAAAELLADYEGTAAYAYDEFKDLLLQTCRDGHLAKQRFLMACCPPDFAWEMRDLVGDYYCDVCYCGCGGDDGPKDCDED